MDQRLTDLLTNQNATNLNVTSEYKLLRNPKAQKEVQKPVRSNVHMRAFEGGQQERGIPGVKVTSQRENQ